MRYTPPIIPIGLPPSRTFRPESPNQPGLVGQPKSVAREGVIRAMREGDTTPNTLEKRGRRMDAPGVYHSFSVEATMRSAVVLSVRTS